MLSPYAVTESMEWDRTQRSFSHTGQLLPTNPVVAVTTSPTALALGLKPSRLYSELEVKSSE